MSELPKYCLVESSALPEVFLRVALAKRNLESGRAKTVSEAVKQAGISRSAFYKYRDTIRPFYESGEASIITFHMMLVDTPGVLSAVLSLFAENRANVLTINQTIPINGLAAVTISARTASMTISIDEFSERMTRVQGLSKFEIIAG
ncbi:ACT domain-containing protein [Oscillospiraceae bacterium OttesenSCG-928-G22]|nr:ACT domain-containing protein [Oscillospiraceae bacterium OttesenSCG-928-G22]